MQLKHIREQSPYLKIRTSFVSSFALRYLVSPTLPGITHWRQAFAKIRLLAFGFLLLIGLARLLFRAGARTSTAWQCDKERRNEKCHDRKFFHMKLRTIR